MSIYKVRHIVSYRNLSENMNVHHYEFPGYVPTTTELQEFVNGFDTAHRSNLRPHLSANVSVQPYGLRRVDMAEQPEEFYTPTGGLWQGIGSGDDLPSWIGILTIWKANSAFPRTARAFGMCVTESNNTATGNPHTALQTAYTSYANACLEIPVTGQDSALKVAARYQEGGEVVGLTNPLTSTIVRPYWGTQRRRRIGVGS